MQKSLYYGEIVAKISAHLYQNPDHVSRIEHSMSEGYDDGETISTICADAARVFDTMEDLSGELFIDWHEALDLFANDLLDHLLAGQKPHIVDMISMASHSIQNVR